MYRNRNHKYHCRARFAICSIAIGIGFGASAQTPPTHLSFEVATVKPVLIDASHPFNSRHFGAHVNPAGASYWSMTVGNLVDYAYGVEPFQVTGPEWGNADRFDIEAKFPGEADKKDDRQMLQAILKERFNLTFHIEKRELEIYALVVGKHGEKLRPSFPDPATPAADTSLRPTDGKAGAGQTKSEVTKNQDGSSTIHRGTRGTQTIKFDQENWANHFEFSKMTMEELAGRLSSCMGSGVHKVFDETGVIGSYQVALDCPLPRPPVQAATGAAGALPFDPEDGSLLTRSLDALGLKLEKRKMLMEVYVIDHVEKPSEN